MQTFKYIQDSNNLLAIYEYNYMLFRLVLPVMPDNDGWFMLIRQGLPNIYVSRISVHPYTSEWIIGHFFPQKQKQFAPNYIIRLYHDARLSEVMRSNRLPINQQRAYKIDENRGLAQWLNYCHRRGYALTNYLDCVNLPKAKHILYHV